MADIWPIWGVQDRDPYYGIILVKKKFGLLGRGGKSSGKKTKTSAVSKKRKSTKASKSQSNVAAAASSNNQSSTVKSAKLKTKAAREKPNKTTGQASSSMLKHRDVKLSSF